MIITYLFGFIVRGIRWKYMLSPIKKISTRSATEGVIVGYMGNNLLPARAGEIIRAVYIGNTEKISKTTSFGTVAIERIFDGLVVVGILLFSSLFMKVSLVNEQMIHSIILAGTLIFSCGILCVALSVRYAKLLEEKALRFMNNTSSKSARMIYQLLTKCITSLDFLRHHEIFLRVLVCSILVWLVEGFVFWIALKATDLPSSFAIAYLTLALVNLSMLLPSAPGGLGIFQASNILAFSIFGIDKEMALAYSIIIHATMIVPITLIGLYILNRKGFSLLNLRKGSTNLTH